MNKKNLIVIISDLHPKEILGGGQVIAYEFFEILKSEGFNCQFWCTSTQSSLKSHKLNLSNETILIVKKSRIKIIKKITDIFGGLILYKFIYLIISRRPKYIWINQIGNAWPYIIIPILKFFRIKVLITLHDYLVISQYKLFLGQDLQTITPDLSKLTRYEKIRYFFYKTFLSFEKNIVAVSELQRSVLTNSGIVVKHTIPNGVNYCEHINIRKFSDSKLTFHILFAGRLNLKGLGILLESVNRANSEWVVHLAGGFDLLEFCRQNSRGIKYVFHGFLSRDQLSELIHKVDLVFAISQYLDPYPTICLESIRHKVPYLTSKTSGTSRLYNDYFASMLVFNVGEVPDLDKTLVFCRSNQELLNSVANSIPSPAQVVHQYLEIFYQR